MNSSVTKSNELKVGLLVTVALVVIFLFSWMIGRFNPFQSKVEIYLQYNFAGGIEKGSPVRLAGIKVGRVESISFYHQEGGQGQSEEIITPLRLKISIDQEAVRLIRQDSKFFINLAGLIGERYIEITPGTRNALPIHDADVLRGVDPPRIDQLISQSFNLAGKIQKVLEEHEGDITETIRLVNQLSTNLNKTLGHIEKSKLLKTDVKTLVDNLIVISEDAKQITRTVKEAELKRDLETMRVLLKRAEAIDREAVQKFFQKEGIRTRIF